jgi:hypothetical protein
LATIPRPADVLDDLDFAEGTETLADEKRELSYNGKTIQLDLTKAHADALDDLLKPYLEVGTEMPKTSSGGRRRSAHSSGSNSSRADRELTGRIRSWAEQQGIELNPQGRIKNEVREAYFDAHPDERPS